MLVKKWKRLNFQISELGDGSFPETLQEVNVPIVGNYECKCFAEITENMICAGLKGGGKDSCQVTTNFLFFCNVRAYWQPWRFYIVVSKTLDYGFSVVVSVFTDILNQDLSWFLQSHLLLICFIFKKKFLSMICYVDIMLLKGFSSLACTNELNLNWLQNKL